MAGSRYTYQNIVMRTLSHHPDNPALQRVAYAAADVTNGSTRTSLLKDLANLAGLDPQLRHDLAADPNPNVRAAAWKHPDWPLADVHTMLTREGSGAVRCAALAHPGLDETLLWDGAEAPNTTLADVCVRYATNTSPDLLLAALHTLAPRVEKKLSDGECARYSAAVQLPDVAARVAADQNLPIKLRVAALLCPAVPTPQAEQTLREASEIVESSHGLSRQPDALRPDRTVFGLVGRRHDLTPTAIDYAEESVRRSGRTSPTRTRATAAVG